MFERYTEKARRTIFFARYEASQLGQDEIGDVHLLLGLIREDSALFARLLPNYGWKSGEWTFESLRRKIVDAAGPRGEFVSTSVDLPLSRSAKRVLAYAAEEADDFGHKHIGTEHLLLGLLREKDSVAATMLQQEGMNTEEVRRAVSASAVEPPPIGVTGYAGRGRDIGSTYIRNTVVEFICDAAVIASVLLSPGSPVPRAGEQIRLNDKGTETAFHVEEVSYVYERFSPDMVVAPHRLSKVVVRVRRDQKPNT